MMEILLCDLSEYPYRLLRTGVWDEFDKEKFPGELGAIVMIPHGYEISKVVQLMPMVAGDPFTPYGTVGIRIKKKEQDEKA